MSDFSPNSVTVSQCNSCGTELAPGILACPGCNSLVYANELRILATEAARATTSAQALGYWRKALALLPPGTTQAEFIKSKIDEISRNPNALTTTQLPAGPKQEPAKPNANRKGIAGVLAAVGAFLLKFKFLIFSLFTKGKLLLLGLTKMSTLFTMLLSFGVYWQLWGWKFAAGFVLSIYVHEMGHVYMLRRFGIHATTPMFIPGFGALIRLKENLPTAVEDSRVGLAGPVWGMGASLFSWVLALTLHSQLFAAIAMTSAWLNLFNLTPVWQLDGSRAFRAMTSLHRWIAVAALLASYIYTKDGYLIVITVVAVARCFEKNIEKVPDTRTIVEYAGLVGVLSVIMHMAGQELRQF